MKGEESFDPTLSRYLIKEFLQAVVEVSIVELLALFVTFGAENVVKGQLYCSPKEFKTCD